MKTLNHSKTQLIKPILIAAGLAAAVAAPDWATQLPDAVSASAGNAATDAAVDPELVAHANWRAFMAQNSTPAEGCFHASYPNIVWERVDCKIGQPRVHPTHVKPTDDEEEVTGNGNDYVAPLAKVINPFASAQSSSQYCMNTSALPSTR